MSRTHLAVALSIGLVTVSASSLRADVRSDEKTLVKFEGMMGKVIGLFGGKAAREGVTSTVAVKGDRKKIVGDESGQIVDLKDEKIYDLDLKKKTYRVTTFAQLRQQLEEARRKAAADLEKAQADLQDQTAAPAAPSNGDAAQLEVDFDVKETGETKSVNGFDARRIVMTIALREKGKALEQSGGIVLTSSIWMTSSIAAMKEVADFDLRYARAVTGTMIAGASADEMAAAMAMYPMMKDAIERMRLESVKLDGTAVQTVTTIDAVKSAEQIAAEKQQQEQGPQTEVLAVPTSRAGAVAGVLGGFGRRMANRNKNEAVAANPGRLTFMTMTNDVLNVGTTVSEADVAVPAGFKEAR
jgi:hypothetical protein